MTIQEFTMYGSEDKIAFTYFWSSITAGLLSIDTENLDIENILSCMLCILAFLLAATSLSAAPAWKLWQASKLLRRIPGVLMLLGFGIILYFTLSVTDESDSNDLFFFTMTTNFLTTAISLLLYKNESIDHPDHGISST